MRWCFVLIWLVAVGWAGGVRAETISLGDSCTIDWEGWVPSCYGSGTFTYTPTPDGLESTLLSESDIAEGITEAYIDEVLYADITTTAPGVLSYTVTDQYGGTGFILSDWAGYTHPCKRVTYFRMASILAVDI
jgi:hypothetical protein